jgi:hypothetical protein
MGWILRQILFGMNGMLGLWYLNDSGVAVTVGDVVY